ncbi:N(alpha)-acetyltransferase 38, NatC auxiliary [Homalodisca vitripennis]|nr:N(alpha)-acetyltransferase 38, NatC auxiliary [Homalodisca vitripennis]
MKKNDNNMSEYAPVRDPQQIAASKSKLQSWINKHMKIEMTDGRVLIGMFLCTDRDGNVILGSCSEYLNPEGVYRPPGSNLDDAMDILAGELKKVYCKQAESNGG